VIARRWIVTGVLVLALVLSILAAVTIGSAQIPLGDVVASILGHLGAPVATPDPLRDAIVWELRLPRVITAALVGAGLAISGAIMQSIIRNQLADPYLLGLSSGASLGAVSVLLLGVAFVLPVAAFAGAVLALIATLALARAGGPVTPSRTVLAGVAVSSLAGALTSFVIFWTAQGDSYRDVLSWLLGSLAGARWPAVTIAGIALLVVGVPLLFSGRLLDGFAFGDTSAAGLGINVQSTRWMLLTATALLTGAMVSVSGAIGFIGLVVPHAVRLVVGPGNRILLPLAALAGGIFLVWADTLARTAFDPRELPVGIITALVGAPVFAALLLRRRRVA